jgi:hypothetical protein
VAAAVTARKDENRRLKTLVADFALDNQVLKGWCSANGEPPTARRLAVGWLQDGFGMSQRRSCRVLDVVRSTIQYRSRRHDDGALRA